MLDELNAQYESVFANVPPVDYNSEDIDERLDRHLIHPIAPVLPLKALALEDFDVRKWVVSPSLPSYWELSREFLESLSVGRTKSIDLDELDSKFNKQYLEKHAGVREVELEASVVGIIQDQLFPVETSFVVSSDLQKKYVSSALALRSANGISTSEVLQMASSGDLLSELSRKIRAQFVSWAQSKRSKSPQTISIFRDGSFNPFLQIIICDALLVVPDSCKVFLNQLADDLKAYLLGGGRFFGEWGEFKMMLQGEILLFTAELETETQAGFKKSRRLE